MTVTKPDPKSVSGGSVILKLPVLATGKEPMYFLPCGKPLV